MVSSQEINQLLDYLDVPMVLPPDEYEEESVQAPSVDSKSEGVIASLDPSMHSIVRQFLAVAAQSGIQLRVVSGYRSPVDQEGIYQQGRSTDGPVVTNAKPGYSKHNFGVAFDVAPVQNGEVYWPNDSNFWSTVGSIGKSLGLKWGGDWAKPDLPHFEHPTFEMRDLLMGRAQTMYSKENLDYIAQNKMARMQFLLLLKYS